MRVRRIGGGEACAMRGAATRPDRGGALCTRLWADESAAVLMEYAFVGPPFIALILAILHTSLIFLAQEGLETAAESTSRLIMTGQAQTAGYTAASFKTAACASLPKFLACDRLYVDVQTAASYGAAAGTTAAMTYDTHGNVNSTFAYTPGTQNQIVVLRLMYLWPTVTGPFGLNLTNQPGNQRLLYATSVFTSESY